ncbi:MAG: ribonuclease HII [Chloroflexi bacterium]|nr:ribonuclease HII [Chloroflexota bacterium]
MVRSDVRSSTSSAGLPAERHAFESGEHPAPHPAPDGPRSPRGARRPSLGAWPSLRIESLLWGAGVRHIAGVDEAGRGALAGPVVAAAVVLPGAMSGVRDSKQLTPTQRSRAAEQIRRVAYGVGVGIVPASTVDNFGIAFAGQLAFRRAVWALTEPPDYLLVDGFPLWSSAHPQLAVLQGDARSLSIAAASIIAKVTRDQIMAELDEHFPAYGFAHNRGYGTPSHCEALLRLGPCPYHRRSYEPVAAVCSPVEVRSTNGHAPGAVDGRNASRG